MGDSLSHLAPAPLRRIELRPILITIGLALVGACLAAGFLLVAGTFKPKITIAIVVSILGLLAGLAFGNPRILCLWGLMLTIPFDISKRIGPIISKLGGETSYRIELSDFFWVALMIFIARDLWVGYRKGIRIPKVTYVWMSIMGFGLAAVLFGTYSLTASHEVVRMLKDMLLFLVIANELTTLPRFLNCAAALTVSLVIQASFGLTEYAMQKNFGLVGLGETSLETTRQLAQDSIQGEAVFRAGAFMIHPNIFGIFLAIVLPMIIGVFLLRTGKLRPLFVVAILLGMPALIVTYSRSSWVAMAINTIVLFVLLLFHRGLRRRSMMAGGVAACLLLVVCIVFAGPISKRIFDSKAGAMLARAQFEGNAYEMIAARPWFGWGLNSYADAVLPYSGFSTRYGGWVPVTHNGYLLWAAETGIVGMSLHVLFILCIMWTAMNNMRVKDELLFVLNAAVLSSMFGILMDERFSPSLRANPILRVFWVLAGIVAAIRYWRLRQERGKPGKHDLQPAMIEAGDFSK